MKYYLDTEFIEAPNTIDLISIGIKCEDGRTFYAESTCFDERKASEWVKENVLSKLRWYGNVKSTKGFCNVSTNEGRTEAFGTLDVIRIAVIDFIGFDEPEFWGYYADYDWVVFCWLFGPMVDLPKGWPMYCKDLKQLADETDTPQFPSLADETDTPHFPPPLGEHDALVDAIWNEKFYKYLTAI